MHRIIDQALSPEIQLIKTFKLMGNFHIYIYLIVHINLSMINYLVSYHAILCAIMLTTLCSRSKLLYAFTI